MLLLQMETAQAPGARPCQAMSYARTRAGSLTPHKRAIPFCEQESSVVRGPTAQASRAGTRTQAAWPQTRLAQHSALHGAAPQSKGQGAFSDLEGLGCNLPLAKSHKWPKKFATPPSLHPGSTGPATRAGPLDPIDLSSAALRP